MPRPKNKKYKSLDEENILDNTEEVEEKSVDTNDIEEAEKDNECEDVSTNDESSKSLSEIVPNLPPKKMWSDDVKLKYKIGDIVVKKGDKTHKTVMKVLGPGTTQDTYAVKNSGSDSIWYIPINEVKRAPKDTEWFSYVEYLKQNDPYEKFKRQQESKKSKKSKKK
jgi:hypothetical protein